jgi:hypothetical protein
MKRIILLLTVSAFFVLAGAVPAFAAPQGRGYGPGGPEYCGNQQKCDEGTWGWACGNNKPSAYTCDKKS